MAGALRKAGLEGYHDKGDEFLCRGNQTVDLQARLERARAILRDHTILVEQGDGSTVRIAGADFSYGVGKDMYEAELGLRIHKARRESVGEIGRGELRGITVRTETARICISTTEEPRDCLDSS
jgi:hypothetical protein